MKKAKTLEYNVYYHNPNTRQITYMNIFRHNRFNNDVMKNLKKYDDKNMFAEKLKSDLMYYFWCKCEYEIIISPLSTYDDKNTGAKIDIYNQVMLNWDLFLNYVWSNKPVKKPKAKTVNND